jgi:hypothetical protein
MKNLVKVIWLVMFLTVAQASQSEVLAHKPVKAKGSETMDGAEAQKLINRLEEIKAMDRTQMTKSEKRALRKEVRASEEKLSASGGVYLSVGAIIIIILLLILLL